MAKLVVELEREQSAILNAAIPRGIPFGLILPGVQTALDAMAQRLEVPSFEQLGLPKETAPAPVDEFALALEDDLSTSAAQPWFAAAEGLRTVRGLLTLVRQKPALVQGPGIKSAHDVIYDLEVLERILEMAHTMKIRFRLARQ